VTIHFYFPSTNTFDPEAILAMSAAFELACADLQVFAGDERGREIIATRIIHLARQGLIDAAALHQRVVAEARLSA
jgi:hypothetical protein